ncbi:winged helix-turn-helix domain-containing protein [Rheinheimera sp.]|uniref:winged helix-turn-helix domain-containing protein n=1 Tax=Rheinheimera sp. TaxID=1869214 RepID=UPI0027BAA22C|nr:winged helix-turn-helix domain-containing protein [Rheinheimera sp.]
MSKVILGDFILDTSSNLLFSGDIELGAEPKVLELLAYLYSHRDRYSSLQELHDQVWPGRVVSDTAVRGTIKKLRTLLGDSDIAEPKYIKSLSKRGYKLICDVADFPIAAAESIAPPGTDVDLLHVSGGYTAAPEQPEIHLHRPVRLFALVLLLFVSAAMLWLVLLWQQQTPLFEESPLSGQLIPMPAGEKRGLTVSPDGSHLAFIGRQNQSEPWQIYVMNRRTRDIRILPVASQQPSMLVFDDDQSLLVVDQRVGDSSIYHLQLDKSMQLVREQTVANFPIISHLSPGTNKGDWLINAADKVQGTLKLYQWQTGSKELKLLQARSSAIEHIYQSVYSPSGQWLANAVLVNGVEFRLEIQDVQSKRIRYSGNTVGRIGKLDWFGEESLLALDKRGLVLVEFGLNNQRLLMEHGEGKIADFSITAVKQQLLLLQNEYLSEPVFRELFLTPEVALKRLVNVPPGVRMINYADGEQGYFGVVQTQNNRMLVKFDHTGIRKEVLYSTDQQFELLDHHPKQNALLLHVGQQLLVLNLKNNSLELISSSQSYLDNHATFSLDGNKVYFGQLIAGQWELHQFERATKSSRPLVKGYRSVRETAVGFVGAMDQGGLYLLDQQFRQIKPLGYSINTDFISRWYVKGQQLIWSDFDLASTWLNQLDLISGELKKTNFLFEKMWPRFAINEDGNQILVYSLGSRTTNLHEVDLSVFITKK